MYLITLVLLVDPLHSHAHLWQLAKFQLVFERNNVGLSLLSALGKDTKQYKLKEIEDHLPRFQELLNL